MWQYGNTGGLSFTCISCDAVVHTYDGIMHTYDAVMHTYDAVMHTYDAVMHTYDAVMHTYDAGYLGREGQLGVYKCHGWWWRCATPRLW